LHSVSPGNFFGKKFNGTPFEKFFDRKKFLVSSTNLNSPKEHTPLHATEETNRLTDSARNVVTHGGY